MIQCRFGLDELHLDAEIVAAGRKIANGGSLSSGIRLYLRFLHYQSKCQNMTSERQDVPLDGQNMSINLSSLDEVFSGLEE